MTAYTVNLTSTLSATVGVEANTPEEAANKAPDTIPSICGQCGGWGQDWSKDEGDEWWVIEVYADDNENAPVWSGLDSPDYYATNLLRTIYDEIGAKVDNQQAREIIQAHIDRLTKGKNKN